MSQTLHPDLARIAAAYDDIVSRQLRGELSPGQAQRAAAALVARDDNGLRWSISASTGQWQYHAADGTVVSAEPPSCGIALPTPWQLGSQEAGDPDERVVIVSRQSLPQRAPEREPGRKRSGTRAAVATALTACAAAAGLGWLLLT